MLTCLGVKITEPRHSFLPFSLYITEKLKCPSCGLLILGAQIVYINEDDSKIACSSTKYNFYSPHHTPAPQFSYFPFTRFFFFFFLLHHHHHISIVFHPPPHLNCFPPSPSPSPPPHPNFYK